MILNAIIGVVLGGMMALSMFFGGFFLAVEGFGEVTPPDAARLAVMTVATVAGFRLTHLILRRLIQIVDTVRAGEPFVQTNAVRLRRIAWELLAVEVLSMLGLYLLRSIDLKMPVELEIPWTVSTGMLIAVPLLLVLSRVFEEGSRMRAGLEAPA